MADTTRMPEEQKIGRDIVRRQLPTGRITYQNKLTWTGLHLHRRSHGKAVCIWKCLDASEPLVQLRGITMLQRWPPPLVS